jgi:prevent-host-death family protein
MLMTINITQDIRSITDLKRETGAILRQVHETGRPIVLTVNGKAEAVLLDAVEYEKIEATLAMLKALLKGEEDILSGKVTDAREFFREFRRAKKV